MSRDNSCLEERTNELNGGSVQSYSLSLSHIPVDPLTAAMWVCPYSSEEENSVLLFRGSLSALLSGIRKDMGNKGLQLLLELMYLT